jgi:hypothetical protein
MKVPEIFDLVCRLAIKEGAAPLSKNYSGRCWERDLGGGLWIAMNGNPFPVKCSKGNEIPPFTIYGDRLGWPAILVDPAGGCSVAPGWGSLGGPSSNPNIEDKFIEAVKSLLEKEA